MEESKPRIILVPIAHIHKKSIALVRSVIQREQPDYVGVELCAQRLEALFARRSPHLRELLGRPKSALLFLLQQGMGKMWGITPGSEMKEAVLAASKTRTPVLLLDRPIGSIAREIERIPLREWMKILLSPSRPSGMGKMSVDTLMRRENLEKLLAEMEKNLPRTYGTFVARRDGHMAAALLARGPAKTVAVVGAAHVPGIARRLESAGAEYSIEGWE